MAVCKTCGSIIAFEGGVCLKCKAQSEADSKQAGINKLWGGTPGQDTGKNGVSGLQGSVFSTGMEKAGLIKKLERYKQLLGECDELQAMIKPQSSFPSYPDTSFKTRSFMRYFWPYLLGGILGGYLVYMVSSMLTMSMAIDITGNPREAASRLLGETFAGLIVGLIIAAAVIFFGVKVAKRKQADFNSNAEFMNRQATERYNMGVNNQKMIDLYQENINEMYKYESLVPEQYRTFEKVSAIIELLNEDKAKTVEEACLMV